VRTSADAGFVTSVTSDTYSLSLSTTGLSENTTYYFKLSAVNKNGIEEAYVGTPSTSTLTNAPVFTDFTSVDKTSLDFNWSDGENPAGTMYRVLSSTAPNPASPDGAVVVTSDTYNVSLSTTGLNPNVTYYFKLSAVNNNGIEEEYLGTPSTSTLANVPSDTSFSDINFNIVKLHWSENGNPDGTLYRVLSSDDSGFATSVTSDTYNLYLSTEGLIANTTYYFRVSAINNNDVETVLYVEDSTSTFVEYDPAFVNFTNVFETSIQVNWANGGNPGGTLYRVYRSEADDFATSVTSDTYNLSLSTTGLNSNTTYYFRVVGVNNNNVVTGYSESPSTSTLANIPEDTSFSGVTDDTIQFNWLANGNSDGTLYRVLSSTALDPLNPSGAVVVTSDTYNLYLSSTGLVYSTDYYFIVTAKNNNEIFSTYTSTITETTLPEGGIGIPITDSITNVGFNFLEASWQLVSGATGYTLAASLGSANPPSIFASSTTIAGDDLSAKVEAPALTPNTTYYLFVKAKGLNASSPWSAYSATSTLLQFAPTSPSFTNMAETSVQFNWSDGGNPEGTLYRVLSADNVSFTDVVTSDTYNTSLSSSGLTANTTYYFKVESINHNGIEMDYIGYTSTSTLANAPVFTDFTSVDKTSLDFNWSDGENPAGTMYRVLSSTAPNPASPDGAVVVTSDTYNVSLSTTGLNPNVTYYFKLFAVNNNGIEEAYVGTPSTSTLANAPVFDNFTRVDKTS
jgi:hypothetical protein